MWMATPAAMAAARHANMRCLKCTPTCVDTRAHMGCAVTHPDGSTQRWNYCTPACVMTQCCMGTQPAGHSTHNTSLQTDSMVLQHTHRNSPCFTCPNPH
jgi:hypothetical protein